MARAKQVGGMEPLPRYTMPDESEPEYALIMDELLGDVKSLIGSSYYYVRLDGDDCLLCRIIHGGGKIYFHEIVNHEQHGISEEDILLATKIETGKLALPGHYTISPIIEKKLRALMEFS